jgi:hypothetical protein
MDRHTIGVHDYPDSFGLRVARFARDRELFFVFAKIGSVGRVIGKVSRICAASITQ